MTSIWPKTIRIRQREWEALAREGGPVAQLVASDALLACRSALLEIAAELRVIGYPVANPLTPPEADLDERMSEIERNTGLSIPPVLRTFWRVIGGVSFVDLDNYAHVDFWRAAGIHADVAYCDGLHIEYCTREWVKFAIDDIAQYREESSEPMFALSPDGYHKDKISGGDPYGLESGEGWFAPWKNFEWFLQPQSALPGTLDFMGYLRTSILECAGFPGLYGDLAFEPIRLQLLRNVDIF